MGKSTKKPVVPKFEVFAMVHEQPSSFVLHAGMAKIEKNARSIQKVLTSSGKLAVFSSGEEASDDTAQRLIEAPWISEHSVVSTLIRGHLLSEGALKRNPSAESVLPQLQVYASLVRQKAQTDEHTGMVLVVGPEFVADLPEKTDLEFNKPPNTEALALNRFQLEV